MRQAERLWTSHKSPPQAPEVLAKRTLNSKTYDLGNGKYRLLASIAPIHWWDAERREYRDIILVPIPDGDWWIIDEAPYVLKIHRHRPEVVYTSRDTGAQFHLTAPGEGSAVWDEGRQTFLWSNVRPDVDLTLTTRSARIITATWLMSPRADPLALWAVNGDVPPIDQAMDSLARHGRTEGTRFLGQVRSVKDRRTRQHHWTTDVRYPVELR